MFLVKDKVTGLYYTNPGYHGKVRARYGENPKSIWVSDPSDCKPYKNISGCKTSMGLRLRKIDLNTFILPDLVTLLRHRWQKGEAKIFNLAEAREKFNKGEEKYIQARFKIDGETYFYSLSHERKWIEDKLTDTGVILEDLKRVVRFEELYEAVPIELSVRG